MQYVGDENGCKIYNLGAGHYQFTARLITAVKNLRADTNDGPVYDLAGRLLGSNSTTAANLRQGVYIVNGKKLAVE